MQEKNTPEYQQYLGISYEANLISKNDKTTVVLEIVDQETKSNLELHLLILAVPLDLSLTFETSQDPAHPTQYRYGPIRERILL